MGMRWVVGRRAKGKMERWGVRGSMRGREGGFGSRMAASSVFLPRRLLHPGT